MYYERIDVHCFEPIDQKVIYTLTNHLGKSIWQHIIFLFTRAGITSISSGLCYNFLIKKRVEMIMRVLCEVISSQALLVALIENSETKKKRP